MILYDILRYYTILLDVNILYTSTANEEVWFKDQQQHNYGMKCSLPLRHVLEYNIFQFNGENYLSVGGTAMGTHIAPSLTKIFTTIFEETYFDTELLG